MIRVHQLTVKTCSIQPCDRCPMLTHLCVPLKTATYRGLTKFANSVEVKMLFYRLQTQIHGGNILIAHFSVSVLNHFDNRHTAECLLGHCCGQSGQCTRTDQGLSPAVLAV